MSLNHIVIMGRVVRDLELKKTQSGVSCVNFTLAVERDFKNGDEKVTDFVDCVAWRNTADFLAKYFAKGRMAIVSGALQSRKWTDKNGQNRVSWEVLAQSVYFGDSKKDGSNNQDNSTSPASSTASAGTGGGLAFAADIEEDGALPF